MTKFDTTFDDVDSTSLQLFDVPIGLGEKRVVGTLLIADAPPILWVAQFLDKVIQCRSLCYLDVSLVMLIPHHLCQEGCPSALLGMLARLL